jgi:ketosteroid isomerase-like protein
MRSRIIVTVMLVATSMAQNSVRPDSDQSKILALETAWNLAEANKDTKALDQLLARTLVYIDYDGTLMTKGDFLSSAAVPSLHPERIVNESSTVHMYGNSAVVTGIYREKGTEKGKAYLRRGRFTDTWVYQDNTWQCVASQSTLISH